MISVKALYWLYISSLLFLIFLLTACEKKTTCVTDTVANIIGCNMAGRCRVELKDGTAGWTRDPVKSTTVTVCHKEL